MGIAIVVPAKIILEVLNQPGLVKLRDEAIGQLKEQQSAAAAKGQKPVVPQQEVE